MTAWTMFCPHCGHSEPLHLGDEETFMSVGKQIAPGVFELKENDRTSAFVSAQVGWKMIEEANVRITELAAEYDRVVSQLEVQADREISHGPFVGSANRKLFHRPECTWAEAFLNKPTCEVFETHEDAVSAGKKPCRTCCA
jgi:hypothetical protein